MAFGTLDGFNRTTIVASAADVTVPGTGKGAYIAARLVAGAAATLTIYNGATAAANRISTLKCAAAGVDETRFPLRADGTVNVQLSTTASSTIAYVYVR